MRLIDRLKSWLRPDPADALKGALDEKLLPDGGATLVVGTNFLVCVSFDIPSSVMLELARRESLAKSATPQHPNNQPIAVPAGSEDARPVPNDLHDV